jgi:hypothetical protein
MSDVRYLSRPAKAIQRRMLIDACRRLGPFGGPSDYEYVGMGALEFIDFHLMRRGVGVVRMTSIEHDYVQRERYKFNRPYAEVDVLIGSVSERLKDVDWSGLRIVWLDYERGLDDVVIGDVAQLAQRMQPGSVLVVTVNAEPARPMSARRSTLAEQVGEARVPPGTTDTSLARWGWADAQRTVLADALAEDLAARPDGAWLHQLFDFRYADDARMQTFGGIVLISAIARTLELCRFDDLEFVRTAGEDPVVIEVPDLTSKERHHLDRQLPVAESATPTLPGLDSAYAEQYARYYRWYPSPVEAG